MAKKYDDFDEPERDGVFGQVVSIISSHKRGFTIVAVSAAVILLGIAFLGGPDDADMVASESVPVVRADAEGFKSAPDNPGGMEIPYRDSTVFSANGDPAGGTENIMAEDTSEEPLPRDQLFAGLNTDGATQPNAAPQGQPGSAMPSQGELEETQKQNEAMQKVAPVLPGAAQTATQTDPVVAEAIGTPPAGTAPSSPIASIQPKVIEDAPVAEKAPAETAKAEPKADAKANGAARVEPASGAAAAKGVQPGGYYVQLASVKSTAGAAGEFKKLQAKYSGLSGLKYRTQEANLGAKGTFHRIQAGPMSKDDAARICGSIKSSGGSCLVAGK